MSRILSFNRKRISPNRLRHQRPKSIAPIANG